MTKSDGAIWKYVVGPQNNRQLPSFPFYCYPSVPLRRLYLCLLSLDRKFQHGLHNDADI